jgi:L,D-transpeptidase ErfK/SrfK
MLAPAIPKAEHLLSEVIGRVLYYSLGNEETLSTVARRFDVGIQAVMDANKDKKDSKEFKSGVTVILPTAHVLPPVREVGIVINLAEPRLYLFSLKEPPESFPISVGREGWEIPVGETSISMKSRNSAWVQTAPLRAEKPKLPLSVPPGSANYLGELSLNLGWAGFAIHGTSMPEAIGGRISHGSIRMYPEDIRRLFNAVEQGTKVTVIDAPYKLGWQGNTLFLQISSPRRHARFQRNILPSVTEIYGAVREKAGAANIVWDAVALATNSRDGIPVPVAVTDAALLPSLANRVNDFGEKK